MASGRSFYDDERSSAKFPPDRQPGGNRGSIFLGEHDRQNARRLGGIGRVFRAEFHRRIVAVYFPEDALAGVIERAEVVPTKGAAPK